MATRYQAEHLFVGGDQPGIASPGVVDVENGHVLWSGPVERAPDHGSGQVSKVAGLLMPGFVNAHCHTPMVLLRGAGEGLPLQRWLSEVMWPREARLTPEDVYWGMNLGAAELLRNGVTTSVEMYFHPDQIAVAADRAGLRCAITPPIIEDSKLSSMGTVDQQLAAAVELRHQWSDSNLIDVGLGPHSVYAVSRNVLSEVAAVAGAEHLMIHMHIAELETEDDFCKERYGRPMLPYLEDLGMFNTHLLAAHGVWFSGEDRQRLSGHSVGIAHCPTSNVRHANGIAPVVALRDQGIPVGLGTDGPASQPRLDMFAEMRLAIGLARLKGLDAALLQPLDAIAMATTHAATALGRTDIGTLEAGNEADMINVAVDGTAFSPVLEAMDLLSHLVWSGSTTDVRNVWVGGRQVVEDGVCTTVDVTRAKREVITRARRIASD